MALNELFHFIVRVPLLTLPLSRLWFTLWEPMGFLTQFIANELCFILALLTGQLPKARETCALGEGAEKVFHTFKQSTSVCAACKMPQRWYTVLLEHLLCCLRAIYHHNALAHITHCYMRYALGILKRSVFNICINWCLYHHLVAWKKHFGMLLWLISGI